MFAKIVFVNLMLLFLVYNGKLIHAGEAMVSVMDVCKKQYPVANDEEVWLHFKKNGEIPDESDKNAKCQFFCIPNKLGIVDDNGVLDEAKAKEIFMKFHPDFSNPDAVDQVIQECRKDNSGMDVCDSTYEYKKCMMKKYLSAKQSR
uniref:Odorant binding protein 6 n=1 Tax=Drosicha corpulenta TaxID=535978 RepID=A0A0U3SQ56_9HEMI|nr:odorant binding protein 6 [Drosicha corpulenta]